MHFLDSSRTGPDRTRRYSYTDCMPTLPVIQGTTSDSPLLSADTLTIRLQNGNQRKTAEKKYIKDLQWSINNGGTIKQNCHRQLNAD